MCWVNLDRPLPFSEPLFLSQEPTDVVSIQNFDPSEEGSDSPVSLCSWCTFQQLVQKHMSQRGAVLFCSEVKS